MNADQMVVKIKALCSVPRLGFNDHFGAMNDTLNKFGIPLGWYTGAYWDKCVAQAFEDTVNQVDLILAIDYDTLATPQHLRRMIDTICQNPHVDALSSNQPRRSTGLPLWTIKGEEGQTRIETSGGLIKATTAHFGFTLIRTSALKDIPLPWFRGHPSKDGTAQGDGQIDPDIAFWLKWADHGKTLFIEQSVCIGHIEAMVSFFEHVENKETGDCELVQKYISTSEWRKRFGSGNGMASLGEQETR